VEIAALCVLLVAATAMFWRVRPQAGGMMLPYLAWVTFASALNFSI
jgi:translocator protein